MHFQYDEREGTFYFFLISIYALCLLPLTFYLWPQNELKETQDQLKRKCHCDPCQHKRLTLKANSPWKSRRKKIRKLIFIILWLVFGYFAFTISQIEMESGSQFDPFAELGIDREASVAEIRRAYRQLSLKHHPDKGGDQKRFIMIAKAFAALTNEESKKNWMEHGNPDGPEATRFGIALPKWIVDKKNSYLVLGAYLLVFMVIMPISVGTWWYRRIRFDDNVLRHTSTLYFRLLSHSSIIAVKRIIMILAASYEFDRGNNSEIVERPSDNEELTSLVRQLPHVNITIRERPFCAVYATKARALIHAHLGRLPLPASTLQVDKQIVLNKCPWLINEMINVVSQIIATISYHKSSRANMPRIDTIENIMRVSPMLLQALWDNQSPIFQLPHIREDMLRHFITKRRSVRSIAQLAEMSEEDRRALLRNLSDDQYRDLINVISAMPHVEMECSCKVVDEEDNSITANSVVTVFVSLYRRNMSEVYPSLSSLFTNGSTSTINASSSISTDNCLSTNNAAIDNQRIYCNGDVNAATYSEAHPSLISEQLESHEVDLDDPRLTSSTPQSASTKNSWEKNRNKKKRSAGINRNKAKSKSVGGKKQPEKNAANQNNPPFSNETSQITTIDCSEESEDEAANPQPMDDDQGDEALTVDNHQEPDNNINNDDDDDEDWHDFKRQMEKENSLITKQKCSHLVHCPYFPGEKTESWWIYVADRRTKMLITPPVQIVSLESVEEVQLKFCPNAQPGQYVYTVCLRSDCYMDMDILQNIKISVSEAKKVETDHPQLGFSDEDKDLSENEADSDCHATFSKHNDDRLGNKLSENSETDYDYDD